MPRLTVHDLAQAVAALRAGAEAKMHVSLESAPDAARYLGAAYFLAMIERARAAVPEARCDAVLDCGDAPGLALDALRRGAATVRLSARQDVRERVAAIAAQTGARLETAPPDDPVLDLAGSHDPEAAARRFLASIDCGEAPLPQPSPIKGKGASPTPQQSPLPRVGSDGVGGN